MTTSQSGFLKKIITFFLIANISIIASTYFFASSLYGRLTGAGNFFDLLYSKEQVKLNPMDMLHQSIEPLPITASPSVFSREEIAYFKSFERSWDNSPADLVAQALQKRHKSLDSESTNQVVLQSWIDHSKQFPLALFFHMIIGIVVHSREQYRHLQTTWAQQPYAMDTVRIHFIFFSRVILDDPLIEIIDDPSSSSTIYSIIERMDKECIHCTWFMIVEDTTMVYLPSLVKKLNMENAEVKQVFGFPVSRQITHRIQNVSEKVSGPKLASGTDMSDVRYADRRAGYVFSRELVKSLASSGIPECAKNFITKPEYPGEIGLFYCLLSKMNIQVKNYHGLNPTHPDVIINDLIQGTRSIMNLYGDEGTMNVFAIPMTHGDITNAAIFRQYYEAYYRPPELIRRVHQIWIGTPKQRIIDAIDHCRELNGAATGRWQHQLWGVDEIRKEFGQAFLDRFPGYPENHNTLLQLTDTTRLFIIYRFGGFYLDADSYCVRPFDGLMPMVKGYQFFISRESERYNNLLANGILGGVPRSQTMQLHLYRFFEIVLQPDFKDSGAWTITGPLFVTYNSLMFRSFVNLIILPSHTFIPIHFGDLSKNNIPKDKRVPYAEYKGSFTLQYFGSTIGENVKR